MNCTIHIEGDKTVYGGIYTPFLANDLTSGVLESYILGYVDLGLISLVRIENQDCRITSANREGWANKIRVTLDPIKWGESKPDSAELTALAAELKHARNKFPDNHFMFEALAEEIGEMADAFRTLGDTPESRKEALQVACVAMRIVTEGPNREGECPDTLDRLAELEPFARGFFSRLLDRPDLSARSEPSGMGAKSTAETIMALVKEDLERFFPTLGKFSVIPCDGAAGTTAADFVVSIWTHDMVGREVSTPPLTAPRSWTSGQIRIKLTTDAIAQFMAIP